MNDKMLEKESDENCGACTLKSSRREFFREAALAAAAIVAALGMPARAQALSFLHAAWTEGERVAYPLPSVDGVTIDKEHQIILVRHQGSVYAFALSCPHQRTALKWKEDDGRFQCPKHKSKYQPDGTFISGRATRGMDRYSVKKKGAEIVVDVTKLFREDKEKAEWAAAVVSLGGANVR
jgi:nitrite reductase/ring-hydroxylating ferredoxin subunit